MPLSAKCVLILIGSINNSNNNNNSESGSNMQKFNMEELL